MFITSLSVYNDSVPVLESIKLIGGKLMEQAGMTENNYLCIMAFDKLAVWGGTNIKHTSNGNAQCSLTLLENFSEAREEGKRSCSKLGETSTEEDAPHCYLALLKGWKLEGNNKYSVGFIYKRPQKGFFFALWCSCQPEPCPYFQSHYITLQPF